MKKNIFILMLLMYSFLHLKAQHIGNPGNIQSPNSYDLGKYGDIPVSLFTGTPNINIPLYQLNVKGVKLDVSLNYDASGIRLDQHPGWVGQNWTVNVGGVITRSVQGEMDEYKTDSSYDPYPNKGFLYRNGDLSDSNTSNLNNLKTLGSNAATKNYDYEPDIFTFNFMGYSGKFFMDNDGKWKVSSEDNLLIIFDDYLVTPFFEYYPGNSTGGYKYPKVIGGFKIKDDKGITYVFGYNEDAIEYGMGFYNQVFKAHAWKANSWYLTKVIDCTGDEIYRFEYERDSFIAQFYRADKNTNYDLDGNGGLFNPAPACAPTSGLADEGYYIEGELISPVYLSKVFTVYSNIHALSFLRENSTEIGYDSNLLNAKYIQYSNYYTSNVIQELPFYYLQEDNDYIDPTKSYLENLSWKKLNCIIVNGDLYRKFDFIFKDEVDERLCLEGIDIYDKTWPYNSNTKKYSYDFQYNQFGSLPGYLSKKKDHWGYNNGSAYVRYSSNSANANFYNYRQSNASYLTIGMLSKIIYPTGGYTSFQFESHDYEKIVQEDRSGFLNESGIAGGVRIKKIISNDGSNNIEKNYKYVVGYTNNKSSTISSGILRQKPKYYWADWRVVDENFGEYSQSVFSVNSIIPLGNYFGSHIGYSEVVEERNDDAYTLYKFSNYDTDPLYEDDEAILSFYNMDSPFIKSIDKSILRGKILEKSYYNSNNEIVLKNKYRYESDQPLYNQYALGTNADYFNICSGSAVSLYTGSSYKMYYFDYDVEVDTVINYTENGNVVEISKYDYDDLQVTTTDGQTSNIRLVDNVVMQSSYRDIISDYIYPTDLLSESIMTRMRDSFMVGTTVKILTKEEISSVQKSIGASKTTYKIVNNLIVKDKDYVSSSDESNYFEARSYDVYDVSGKLLQYTLSDGITRTNLWGYGGEHIVAEVIGGTSTVASGIVSSSILDNPSSDAALRTELNKLRTSTLLSAALVKSYTFSELVGKTSYTDPNGIISYYYYDDFGRLKNIKNVNNELQKSFDYNFVND